LKRCEGNVEALERKLQYAPATVMVSFAAQWPYTVQHHEKRGLAEVSIRIVRQATGDVAHTDAVRESCVHRDTTIDNANASIGLSSDPLVLPSDEAVRRTLIDELADKSSDRLLSALMGIRAKEMRTRAEALERKGDTEKAVEAFVDLSRTLEKTEPKEAEAIIERLRNRVRTHK